MKATHKNIISILLSAVCLFLAGFGLGRDLFASDFSNLALFSRWAGLLALIASGVAIVMKVLTFQKPSVKNRIVNALFRLAVTSGLFSMFVSLFWMSPQLGQIEISDIQTSIFDVILPLIIAINYFFFWGKAEGKRIDVLYALGEIAVYIVFIFVYLSFSDQPIPYSFIDPAQGNALSITFASIALSAIFLFVNFFVFWINQKSSSIAEKEKGTLTIYGIWGILSGVILNTGLLILEQFIHFPAFLFIGTMFASALFGLIPGVVTAFISGVLTALIHGGAVYFMLPHMILAIASFFASRLGLFKKLPKTLLTGLAFGLLSALIDLILFEAMDGTSISLIANLEALFKANGVKNATAIAIALSFLFYPIDLLLEVSVFYLFTKFGPKRVLSGSELGHVYLQEDYKAPKFITNSFSLRTKTMFINATIFTLIGFALFVSSSKIFEKNCIESYDRITTGFARDATLLLDGDYVKHVAEVSEGIDYRDNIAVASIMGEDAYYETHERLTTMYEKSADRLTYVYVHTYFQDEDGNYFYRVLFDKDSPAEDPTVRPGFTDAFDLDMLPYAERLLDPTNKEEIGPIISNGRYGSLMSVYEPIFDSEGNKIAYVGVDVDIAEIQDSLKVHDSKIGVLLIAILLVVLCISYEWTQVTVIEPIASLVSLSEDFAHSDVKEWRTNPKNTGFAPIVSGDEIETLYRAVNNTQLTVSDSFKKIEAQTEQLLKMEQNMVFTMAIMVEARDGNTGGHIKRTSTYIGILAREMRRQGKHLDVLTDDYIDHLILAAPLHDVGKIRIPDAILNKPGKLDDEEFAKMRLHTVYGAEIIDTALEGIEGESYLTIAKEIAEGHHEKYDGSGYPHHIKGTDIPLSARLMAVADVFDALMSKRPYKAPMSLEQATSIIVEGKGKHFDPDAVDAFLGEQAQKEIKETLATITED